MFIFHPHFTVLIPHLPHLCLFLFHIIYHLWQQYILFPCWGLFMFSFLFVLLCFVFNCPFAVLETCRFREGRDICLLFINVCYFPVVMSGSMKSWIFVEWRNQFFSSHTSLCFASLTRSHWACPHAAMCFPVTACAQIFWSPYHISLTFPLWQSVFDHTFGAFLLRIRFSLSLLFCVSILKCLSLRC